MQRTHAAVQPALVAFLQQTFSMGFKERNQSGDLPLSCALGCVGAEVSEIALLIAANREAVVAANNSGDAPLHVAFARAASPEILAVLLREGAARRTNDKAQLPLHLYAFGPASAAGTNLLLEQYPEAVFEKDSEGCLPLHRACEAAADDRDVIIAIQQLIGMCQIGTPVCL